MSQQTFPNLTELLEARTRLNANATDAETRLLVAETAIHKNIDGEFNALISKAPVGADLLLLEDSAASFAKKKMMISQLPPDATAIHKTTGGEIAAMTDKALPVAADLLVIEDSADSNNKKKIEIGNLPVDVAVWIRAHFETNTATGNGGVWGLGGVLDESDPGDFTVDLGAGTITINKAGAYSISAMSRCQIADTLNPFSQAQLSMLINGGTIARLLGVRYSGSSSDHVVISCSTVVGLVQNDVVSFSSASGSGNTMTSDGTTINQLVSLARLGS